jgi:NADH dehydrogenase
MVTDWINSPKTLEAITRADALVHLAGTLKPKNGDYIRANITPTETIVAALRDAHSLKRIVFLSYVGASEESPNPYLSTKAQAESILQASNVPCTIFRCTHVFGSPEQPGATAETLLSKKDQTVAMLGSGRQQIKPIYIDDVVSAIMAALHQPQSGVFDLAGPESMSMDDWVKLLNHDDSVKTLHLPPLIARLLPLVVRDLPAALVNVMLEDSVAEAQHTVETFNLKLTSLQHVWCDR